jgi:hypothetical protein
MDEAPLLLHELMLALYQNFGSNAALASLRAANNGDVNIFAHILEFIMLERPYMAVALWSEIVA